MPHLKEHRGPQERHLLQACGWIHSYWFRLLEDCPPRGPSPVYCRSSKTEMVLWLENRYHRFEAWWSCLSQGRCLSREEEDHVQMGGQASWGGASDHNRCPLIQNEGPAGKFMHPTSQLAPPDCIRSCHSLACGCLPSMGQMCQPHHSQAYSQREWQQDYATRG